MDQPGTCFPTWNKYLLLEENVLLRTDSASVDAANLPKCKFSILPSGQREDLLQFSGSEGRMQNPAEKVHEEKTFITVHPVLWKNDLKFFPLRVAGGWLFFIASLFTFFPLS